MSPVRVLIADDQYLVRAGFRMILESRDDLEVVGVPAVGGSHWPWEGLQVFVLTSQPLPPGTPAGVVSAADPADLLELMRTADFTGDVHLVGGQRTVDAFRGIGALDELGIVTLSILLGDGLRLTRASAERHYLRLDSSRTFPDGAVELTYTFAAPTG